MGLFGMSEKELKDYANQLEARTTELDNRESDVKRKEADIHRDRYALDAERTTWEKEAAQLAFEKAEFEKRRQELARREMEAKAGFAKEQEEAFREVVEKRQEALDARQKQLDELAAGIAVRLAQATEREGQLAKRELEVTEREQLAAAGFADKATALAAEAKRQHEANQAEASRLEEREKRLAEESARLEAGKEALRQREEAVAQAERERDAGFADIRSALDRELDARRMEFQREDAEKRSGLQKMLAEREAELLADLDAGIEGLRKRRLEELEAALSQRRTSLVDEAETEARRIREAVHAEREAWNAEHATLEEELKARCVENEKKAGELSAREDHLQGERRELECLERQLEDRRESLNDEVETRVADCKATLEAENKRLLESLRFQSGLLGAFKQMEAQFNGKDPAEVLRDLNAKMEELARLREELATRPTEEMRERYDTLERERAREKERADELEKRAAENAAEAGEAKALHIKNAELEELNQSLKNRAELWEAAANEAQAELQRLRSAYERPAEVEERYKEIEMPLISKDKIGKPPTRDEGIDELTWLQGIGNACDNYGLHFPQRILKAFHTSLKNAEWSPITILAGVSGTGKSELPRLYAHFGGLFCETLAVQPNWDSQESMLGFFNSIDNKFDAQPVLRFLAQSQKPWSDEYPGLQEALCLVLLDEMNLAHPELYFAEFLSKLEFRRGRGSKVLPKLPVKIGAGLPPYQLPIGRNVLWTGTMNQDETTHSLSDKVLDRSTVIFFPRPITLERRVKLKSQNEKNRGPLLHKDTFLGWCTKESPFTDGQVKPFKEFIEEMNGYLGVAGRAIGHRVWQSLEYYMANYPDVRAALTAGGESEIKEAMHIAFEDQLVQKIMPKLRGIDTRGKSKTECLDEIRKQLATGGMLEPFENLLGDFDLACELGHGQFIWQSANYLSAEKDFQATAGVPETTPDVPGTEDTPPSRPKRKKTPRPREDEV